MEESLPQMHEVGIPAPLQLLHKQGISKARAKQRYKDKGPPMFIVC